MSPIASLLGSLNLFTSLLILSPEHYMLLPLRVRVRVRVRVTVRFSARVMFRV